MKYLMNTRQFSAGLMLSAVMVGCASHSSAPKVVRGQDFAPDCQATSLGKIAQAQSAAGAKEDGMLFDQNFHGGELNSLGQGKLDLIVKGTAPGDAVFVYLNMPHDQVAARQTAVTSYLKTAGVSDDKMIVAEGPNPNLHTPTAYNLGSIYKQDGTSYSGQAIPQTTETTGVMGGK